MRYRPIESLTRPLYSNFYKLQPAVADHELNGVQSLHTGGEKKHHKIHVVEHSETSSKTL